MMPFNFSLNKPEEMNNAPNNPLTNFQKQYQNFEPAHFYLSPPDDINDPNENPSHIFGTIQHKISHIEVKLKCRDIAQRNELFKNLKEKVFQVDISEDSLKQAIRLPSKASPPDAKEEKEEKNEEYKKPYRGLTLHHGKLTENEIAVWQETLMWIQLGAKKASEWAAWLILIVVWMGITMAPYLGALLLLFLCLHPAFLGMAVTGWFLAAFVHYMLPNMITMISLKLFFHVLGDFLQPMKDFISSGLADITYLASYALTGAVLILLSPFIFLVNLARHELHNEEADKNPEITIQFQSDADWKEWLNDVRILNKQSVPKEIQDMSFDLETHEKFWAQKTGMQEKDLEELTTEQQTKAQQDCITYRFPRGLRLFNTNNERYWSFPNIQGEDIQQTKENYLTMLMILKSMLTGEIEESLGIKQLKLIPNIHLLDGEKQGLCSYIIFVLNNPAYTEFNLPPEGRRPTKEESRYIWKTLSDELGKYIIQLSSLNKDSVDEKGKKSLRSVQEQVQTPEDNITTMYKQSGLHHLDYGLKQTQRQLEKIEKRIKSGPESIKESITEKINSNLKGSNKP